MVATDSLAESLRMLWHGRNCFFHFFASTATSSPRVQTDTGCTGSHLKTRTPATTSERPHSAGRRAKIGATNRHSRALLQRKSGGRRHSWADRASHGQSIRGLQVHRVNHARSRGTQRHESRMKAAASWSAPATRRASARSWETRLRRERRRSRGGVADREADRRRRRRRWPGDRRSAAPRLPKRAERSARDPALRRDWRLVRDRERDCEQRRAASSRNSAALANIPRSRPLAGGRRGW